MEVTSIIAASVMETFPLPDETVIVPNVLPAVVSVTSLLVVVKFVAPAAIMPLCVSAAPAVTVRVPVVPPPRMMASVSLRLVLVRLPPFVAAPKVTVPKLFD